MTRFLRCTIVLSWLLIVGSAIGQNDDPVATREIEPLLVASSERHIWFVAQDNSEPPEWRLMHHALGMDGPYARTARRLSTRPIAIAAFDNRVLLAMAPTLAEREQQRRGASLLGLEVRSNDSFGSFFDVPLDGWDLLASVPQDATLLGVSMDAEGPIVLLGPDRRVVEGVRRTAPSSAQDDAEGGAQLLQQRAFSWLAIALPETLRKKDNLRLLPPTGIDTIAILSGQVINELSNGEWAALAIEPSVLDTSKLLRVARHQDRLVVASGRADADNFELLLERGASFLRVVNVPVPSNSWGLASHGAFVLVIEQRPDGEIYVQQIDPITGTIQPAVVWGPPELAVGDWLYLPFLGMLAVAALLAIVFFRPTDSPDAPLLAGVVPMPFARRAAAMAIDLLPGVVLAALFFDLDQTTSVPFGFFSGGAGIASAPAFVIALTILHEGVGELIWRQSFGKWLLGGKVVAADGKRATNAAVLLRLLFKTIVLYAPILAIFVILSPALQGVPETVSRTVVASTRPTTKLPTREKH